MRKQFLIAAIICFVLFGLTLNYGWGADQVDFPDIYIDADAGDGGVGSEADPYNEFSDINWTTGGDNSVFDYYAGAEAASLTINLQTGDTWREQLSTGAAGSVAYPIIIQSYGSGAGPKILGSKDLSVSGDWEESPQDAIETDYPTANYDTIRFVADWGNHVDTDPQFGLEGATTEIDMGLRFIGVAVPKDATIVSAYLRLKALSSVSTGDCNVSIYGDGTATPAIFSTGADFDGRTQTTATVAWNAVAAWTAGTWYSSPDIASIVSEITSLAGWSSGNNMAFMVYENGSGAGAYRLPYGYSGGVATNAQPQLVITYTSSGTVWVTTATISLDVGNLIFNSEASVGFKKSIIGDVNTQGYFYYNATTDLLYMYSASNPGTYYTTIEAALKRYGVAIAHSDITVQNLDIRYQGSHGIQVNGASSTIDNIIIQDNYLAYIGGSYLTGTTRYGNGIEFWDATTDSIIRRNLIDNIYDAAITTQGTTAGKAKSNESFYNNIVSNSEYGFEFVHLGAGSTTNGLYVYNNVFYNNGGGWGYAQRSDQNGTGLKLADNVNAGQSNLFFKNNIVHTSVDRHIFSEDPGNDLSAWEFDYNSYYPDGATLFVRSGVATTNFAGWQTAISDEAASIVVDPLMTDPANGDFTLQSGSPAIDAGVDVGLTEDYFGMPIRGLPDIGFYEYQPATRPGSGVIIMGDPGGIEIIN